jgi:hypothetical protein
MSQDSEKENIRDHSEVKESEKALLLGLEYLKRFYKKIHKISHNLNFGTKFGKSVETRPPFRLIDQCKFSC